MSHYYMDDDRTKENGWDRVDQSQPIQSEIAPIQSAEPEDITLRFCAQFYI